MTKTGTQNRPYDEASPLMVCAIFSDMQGDARELFDWNKRESVQRFAARADAHIRAGGTVTTRAVTAKPATP